MMESNTLTPPLVALAPRPAFRTTPAIGAANREATD
jgi:hypothetical protein